MTPEQRKEAEQLANNFMDLHEDLLFIHKHNLIRNSAHVNNIIRYAMIGMVVMMIAMLALVATFTTRMDEITSYMVIMADDMQRMRGDFSGVTENMRSLETAVVKMDGFVKPMPSIYGSVDAMGGNMQVMRGDLVTVAESMANIQNRMLSMGRHLQEMDRKLIDLSGAVGGIGHDVNIMSRPMSIMPNN